MTSYTLKALVVLPALIALESFPTWKAGEFETQFGSSNGAFVLLQTRRMIVDSQGNESTDPNPTDGLHIWHEPQVD